MPTGSRLVEKHCLSSPSWEWLTCIGQAISVGACAGGPYSFPSRCLEEWAWREVKKNVKMWRSITLSTHSYNPVYHWSVIWTGFWKLHCIFWCFAWCLRALGLRVLSVHTIKTNLAHSLPSVFSQYETSAFAYLLSTLHISIYFEIHYIQDTTFTEIACWMCLYCICARFCCLSVSNPLFRWWRRWSGFFVLVRFYI